jgi:apolipoprotein N-acyltransferase
MPRKIRVSLLLFSSAILLILSFPCTNLEFFAWFAFVPLFLALANRKPIHGFLLSYLFGLIFFAGITYWLINVTFIGFGLLILYLALYFGIFGLIICSTQTLLPSSYYLIFVSSVWVILEYLRSQLFTGFGWALLGYSQYLNLPIIQIADITGVWGVSFLVMMLNMLIYRVIGCKSQIVPASKTRGFFTAADKGPKSFLSITHHYYLLPCLLLFLCLGYGFYKLHLFANFKQQSPFRISVIQGNIPQAIKWREDASKKILNEYMRLSRLVAIDRPDLIVWPEAAFPEVMRSGNYLDNDLGALANDIRIPLLVGAVSLDADKYYNNAILISKQGKLIQRYEKLHLVPFGEYIPLKGLFPFLEAIVPIGDFSRGQEHTIFYLDKQMHALPSKDICFSVLICFEDVFPELSRQFVNKGADFLINITNDAWFGDSSSPYQHLQASVFRAVENGVYLIRAANTGVSGFITPVGRVYPLIDNTSSKQTFISGYKTKDIFPLLKQNSPYTQWGDWFVLACLMITIFGIIRVKAQR